MQPTAKSSCAFYDCKNSAHSLSVNNMEKKVPHHFGNKRKTSHQKGVVPEQALKKMRSGKIVAMYIEDKKKRQDCKYGRKDSIWNKAYEYGSMIGEHIGVEIGSEYFDSKEHGLVKGGESAAPTSVSTRSASTSSEARVNNDSSNEHQPVVTCSNLMLSPRAIRGRGRQVPDQVQKQDRGQQCSLLEAVGHIGNDRFCRVCGVEYETQSRKEKAKWIGCQRENCQYWLHCKCLLGNSAKIKPKLFRY